MRVLNNVSLQAIAADKVCQFVPPSSYYVDAPLQFEAEGAEGHSSSIVDLFDSLRSPINFLQDLEWADDYQDARFYTSLSKVLPLPRLLPTSNHMCMIDY